MKAEEVKRYTGKKVLVILKNNFRYTITIPDFSGEIFTATDKFGNQITLDCDMISLITSTTDNGKRGGGSG